MSLGLVGRKVGMTRIFTEQGESIPVTVLEMEPNRVTQVKTSATDGYNAIQVTVGNRRASRVTKAAAGHFAKAGVSPKKFVTEFTRFEKGHEKKFGDILKADIYFSTGTLAGLRYSKELIKTLMKVEILEESEIYQDVLNKGMEKGRNEGIKEGMERGMERGIKEGMEKGMEKGIEKSIIYVLSTRFNNISPNLIDLIYRTKDESQLYRFLELAVKTNSLSEFEKNM